MHPAAFSIQVFGASLVLTGIGLVVAPALVFSLLALQVPQEIWVRGLDSLGAGTGRERANDAVRRRRIGPLWSNGGAMPP